MADRLPLSVLDVAPVPSGSSVGDALRNSLDLARRTEALGYVRYWVAEHHNMPGIASTSPAVLIPHLADVTTTMRIGSGGVMLPNHSSLTVAEQFGMLEALHPGRIDLALGRAPGTDALTARALRRTPIDADDFPEQLVELLGYFRGEMPADHPYRDIVATPALGNMPPVWLLGSSDFGAQVAAHLGMGFAFAHHFAAANTEPAMRMYRARFRPSDDLPAPYGIVAAAVICGEDDEHAQHLALSGKLSFLRLRTGRPGPFPSPEEAAAHPWTPAERSALDSWTSSHIVGGPDTVRRGIEALRVRTHADEIMVTTNVHDHAERVRSYERLAECFDLQVA